MRDEMPWGLGNLSEVLELSKVCLVMQVRIVAVK